MGWHQRPVDAGQIVNVKYDCDWENRVLYRRTEDRSDGNVRLQMAHILDGEDMYEPWNNVLPAVGEWTEDKGGDE